MTGSVAGSVPGLFLKLCLAAIPLLGVAWLLDGPHHIGIVVLEPEYVSVIVGLAVAAGFLLKPYRGEPGWLELSLGLVAIASWWWGTWNYSGWLLDIVNRGPEKWLPGLVAMLLMIEAMRRNCGTAVAIVVSIFLLYGLYGFALPGLFESVETRPAKVIIYLYSDSNAVPGLVITVGATIVLAFILMGKVMEMSGASAFFTDTAMALLGHRRGGPAKVAVVASSIFGTVNGTTVGNIMTTGVITIPLMKRTGFPPRYAAAIEAVASNGGQLAPPVMGTTAFLIANFLDISYTEVVTAAIVPAVIYYIVLFIQVDRVAVRNGLEGLPRDELPKFRESVAKGWIFLLPLALLMYFLFWLGYNPGKSALYASALMLILGLVRSRRLPDFAYASELIVGSARNMVPLLLVCTGAGLIIGVLNITGLGQSLVQSLAHVGETAGLLPMLVVTAVIAIFLGMGMPTAAVYIVLSVILAPAIVRMGVPPMSAHMFIFYFGLLSMLTPPVAVASFVAAGLAGSDMWRTGITGLKLAASAYLLPFLFVLNPALLMQGSWSEIVIVVITAIVSGGLLARAVDPPEGAGIWVIVGSVLLFALALAVGSSTIWIGTNTPLALLPSAMVLAVPFILRSQTIRTRLGIDS